MSSLADISGMSSIGVMFMGTPRELGAFIRQCRLVLRLSQATLAARAGVSRQWIIEVEAGKPRAEMGLVLQTLRTLGVRLNAEEPPPPGRKRRGSSPVVPDIDAIVAAARRPRVPRRG